MRLHIFSYELVEIYHDKPSQNSLKERCEENVTMLLACSGWSTLNPKTKAKSKSGATAGSVPRIEAEAGIVRSQLITTSSKGSSGYIP